MDQEAPEIGPATKSAIHSRISNTGGTDERRREETDLPPRWPAMAVFGACMFFVLLPPPVQGGFAHGRETTFHVSALHFTSALDWFIGLRWSLAFLVSVPFWLSLAAGKETRFRGKSRAIDFRLNPAPRIPGRSVDREEDVRDHIRWIHTRNASQATWDYELGRFERSLERVRVNALLLGVVTTFALTCCAMVLTLKRQDRFFGEVQPDVVTNLMISVAAATTASFLIKLAGIIVRISGMDISARMFAWATRSVILVVVADVGLFFVTERVMSSMLALALGLFAAATGDHALELLLQRAAKLFGAAAPAETGPSPLLKIEGMTAKHVDRLEEEDILSVHDLAFVPTARLFFSTAYSLQQICNWQDRALLCVYVGAEGAASLGRQMKIMGAIDLLDCAHQLLHESNPKNSEMKTTMSTALTLDEGGLYALLRSMAHDQATRRVRLYWQSSVGRGRARTEQPDTTAAWAEVAELIAVEADVEEARESSRRRVNRVPDPLRAEQTSSRGSA